MLKNSTFLCCLTAILFLNSYTHGAATNSSNSFDMKSYGQSELSLFDLYNESCYLKALDTLNK